LSKTKQRKSPLQPFENRPHAAARPGDAPRPVPKMQGHGWEYPLPNKNPGATTTGPARVVVQEDAKGKLKFKGVVAHDQSRNAPPGTPVHGRGDHFQIKGTYF
jgi:hypothetical protein